MPGGEVLFAGREQFAYPRDPQALQRMVSPGGRVDSDLSRQFTRPIADYARTVGYNQVNWLRGAIAVYLADRSQVRAVLLEALSQKLLLVHRSHPLSRLS
jgi:hypothetical protein